MRTVFLIDGFNLYHSVRDAERDSGKRGLRWLNMKSLCASYLGLIDRRATLESVHYYSAYATHRFVSDPGMRARHDAFLDATRDTGVIVKLAHFKRKHYTCSNCSQMNETHEEKETDTAIVSKLFELLIQNQGDAFIIVSGDTDFAPAIRTASRLFPEKRFGFAFPYNRKNRELARISDVYFKINRKKYAKHLFPDPYTCIGGKKIPKPTRW